MKKFIKGDGFPTGDTSIHQREEILTALKFNGYSCVAMADSPMVFNGSIWAICTNADIDNKLTYEQIKERLETDYEAQEVDAPPRKIYYTLVVLDGGSGTRGLRGFEIRSGELVKILDRYLDKGKEVSDYIPDVINAFMLSALRLPNNTIFERLC